MTAGHAGAGVPRRQVRARYDDDTVTVYQAYPPPIADAALAAGTFVPPFKVDRMTWIKPSFLWMMYRSGWATKPDQERVLAVRITRAGFEEALANSCLSTYEADICGSHDEWLAAKRSRSVRVQWDPERSLHLTPLPHRAIQVGIGGEMVRRYLTSWIVDITDVTAPAHRICSLVETGRTGDARPHLPLERPYPLEPGIASIVGSDDRS